MDLSEKNALILGASRGIGRAIADKLEAAGCRLVLPWFDWPDSCQEMLTRFAGHYMPQTDLRRPEEVNRLVSEITAQLGGLDILINNIERGGMPVVHGGYERPVNQDQWQLEMATTLHAKHLVFNACLPLLKASGNGAVITLSSIAGAIGRSGPASLLFNDGYAAANRGIAALTETWARIAAPEVRVLELMLGLIDTRHGPGTRGWDLLTDQQRKALLDHTLLGRTGQPAEVAELVGILLEKGDFMTGTVIRMDGGYLLGGEQVQKMPEGVV
ncbi:MAG: 3-oxoacyl-ACP reductase [Desulfobulbus propionicus]|nr:MAG: 3-oxoacyl-ACP reductase [Desulfobulbus propionicus]